MSDFSLWVRKWWPGLFPLGLLWVLAAWNSTAPLEQDLTAKTAAALKDTVLDKTQIEIAGRDIHLTADAFSEEGRRSAVAKVESVPGVRLLDDETRLIPEAKPFVWSAQREVARLTLSGNAPLPAIRNRLYDAARNASGGVEVIDRMALSRGAPPRFDAVALLLIDQISKLKDGTVSLSDTNVSLTGMAREIGSREAIAAALKNLPDGYVVADNAVKAPPYFFQANKDPVASTVTLSGYVPDNNVHATIVAAINRKFVGEKVIDNLKASAGAPQGFAAAVVQSIGGLSRVSTGTLILQEREVKLSGDALYPAAAEQIQADLNSGLPQGWKNNAELSVKPVTSGVDPTVCQQLLSDLLSKSTIRFDAGRASIDPDSMSLLDRLIETSLRCPTANLQIAGHTDSDGDTAANVTLSTKRAQSVADYLVKAGIPKERITAVGYGSTKPIAGNDNDEGKAQNRRIEFVVK